ncbi:MAG: porin family protein [Bacteroidetes bacterium]|nr:porin family protein [Bacteroidota bacterium]
MKTKHLLCAILVSLLVISSFESFSQGFGLGMRFGMTASKYSNWSKLVSDDFVNASVLNPPKIGLQVSFVLNPMFSKMFGMEIEFNFEQKGSKMTNSSDISGKTIEYKSTATYNYFTMPILFKGGYKFGMFSVYGIIGPYVGVALGANEKYYENTTQKKEYTVEFGQGETSDDNGKTGGPRGAYKAMRLDAGLTFGVQPGVRLGPGDLVLDFRYNWGFIGVDNPTAGQKTDYNDYASNNDLLPYYPLCNRNFGFSVGYIFRFGEVAKSK